MASSWNKGTLVGQTDQPVKTNVIREKQPSQEEGKSFLETVLDEAASALATGGSYVADVAESAYDLLPESEDIIEVAKNIPDPLDFVFKTADEAGQKSLEILEDIPDFGTSEFRFFYNNLFNAGETLTEENLNATDLETLRQAVIKAKKEGRNSLDYPDFGTSETEVLKESVWSGLLNPDLRMARTVGGLNFYTDEEGNTVIKNTYNFNKGKKRTTFYNQIKKGDTSGALNTLFESISDPVELASIIAYARQEKLKEEGKPSETELVINLGKLP
jgi:hypothetical protein